MTIEPSTNPEIPCVRCGECACVCPERLLPQHVLVRADAARERFRARNARLEREAAERAARDLAHQSSSVSDDAVAAAIERAKAKRAAARNDRS